MIKKFLKQSILGDIFEALWIGIKNSFHRPVTKNLSNINRSEKFRETVIIDKNKCLQCHLCENICPNKSIKLKPGEFPIWNKEKCCYCRLCKKVCPKQAIKIKEEPNNSNEE